MTEIEENINSFVKKFKEINSLGWTKSLRLGSTGVGYTFEKLIGKEEENFEIPDYNGIEIKTKRNFKSQFITIFNANPDGKFLFEIERILEKYGYPDRILKNKNVFQKSIYSSFKESDCINKNKFELNIDREDNKIYLFVYDSKLNLIDKEVFWTFDLLKEKLNRKAKILAIIYANNKFVNKIEYFNYEELIMYELKDFECFLKAIELGYIRITFKIGVIRNGEKKGQMHNHGVGFDIDDKYLSYLYKNLNI